MTAEKRLMPRAHRSLRWWLCWSAAGHRALAAAAGQVQFVQAGTARSRWPHKDVVKGRGPGGDVLRWADRAGADSLAPMAGSWRCILSRKYPLVRTATALRRECGMTAWLFVAGALRAVTGKIGQRNLQNCLVTTYRSEGFM